MEKLESRLRKHAMFQSLKAGLSAEFTVLPQNSDEIFIGTTRPIITAGKDGWRPLNWVVAGGGTYKSLTDEPQPALKILGKGPNTYWHTERFFSSHLGVTGGHSRFRSLPNQVAISSSRSFNSTTGNGGQFGMFR